MVIGIVNLKNNMTEKELIIIGKELLETKSGRMRLFHEIIQLDNISITEIVEVKESAMKERMFILNQDTSGLALRSLAMFGENKNARQLRKQVLPLVKKDLIRLQVIGKNAFPEVAINE